jgi:hypothetical protein
MVLPSGESITKVDSKRLWRSMMVILTILMIAMFSTFLADAIMKYTGKKGIIPNLPKYASIIIACSSAVCIPAIKYLYIKQGTTNGFILSVK